MARNIHTKNSISPWPFIRNKSEIAYEWEIFPAFLIYHHHPAERKIPKVAAPQQYKEEAVQTGTSDPPKEILPVEMNSKRIRIPSFASQLATLRNSSTGTQLQIAPMYFLLPLPPVYPFQWTVRGTQDIKRSSSSKTKSVTCHFLSLPPFIPIAFYLRAQHVTQ